MKRTHQYLALALAALCAPAALASSYSDALNGIQDYT